MRKVFIIFAMSLVLVGCGDKSNGGNVAVEGGDTVRNDMPVYVAPADTTKPVVTTVAAEAKPKADAIVGGYACGSTGDNYVFYSDHTGQFKPGGGTGDVSDFRWKRIDEKVLIYYGEGGHTQLRFDRKRKTIKEYSPMYDKVLTYRAY